MQSTTINTINVEELPTWSEVGITDLAPHSVMIFRGTSTGFHYVGAVAASSRVGGGVIPGLEQCPIIRKAFEDELACGGSISISIFSGRYDTRSAANVARAEIHDLIAATGATMVSTGRGRV